jgi:catechol 2,3-dioxygenase-like lactoylglutathione lyase family enzyme
MIGYVTLGTNDIARAGRFYDDLLSVVGAKQTSKCEGPAGPRSDGFYAGYFRDSDGNKLCAFYMG